jgi:hypothetical protein
MLPLRPYDPTMHFMPTLEVADLDELRRSARSLLQRYWPDARYAASGDLSSLWSLAAEAGWFDTAKDDLLRAMFATIDELGRAGGSCRSFDRANSSSAWDTANPNRGPISPLFPLVPSGTGTGGSSTARRSGQRVRTIRTTCGWR